MKTIQTISRPRWRVSEKVAAELAHAFRNGSQRSWDQFFSALLGHWHNQTPMPTGADIRQETQPIKNGIQTLQGQMGRLSVLLEGQVEALHVLRLDVEQLQSFVNRLAGFLELAFELAGDKLTQPQEDNNQSPEAEIIRKARSGQLV